MARADDWAVGRSRTGGELYWMVTDHLGSTATTYKADGTKTPQHQYYHPWGNLRGSNEPVVPTDTGYTGQTHDQSTGLMHYNARYYDPAIGRFISADTIVPNLMNPQSLNRYAYVLNSPVKFIDPTGHTEATPDSLSTLADINRAHDDCMADPACAPRPPSDPPWHPYRDRPRGNGSMDSGTLWSALADFIPILGDGKGFMEGITGKDSVTGEELPMWARGLGFVGLSELRRLDLFRLGGGTATNTAGEGLSQKLCKWCGLDSSMPVVSG